MFRLSQIQASLATAVVLCAGLLAGAALPAHADTYSLITVDHSDREDFALGDDFGNYAINVTYRFDSADPAPGACGGGLTRSNSCYLIGNVLQGTSYLTTVFPQIAPDPNPVAGGGCDIPSGPQWSVGRVLCNNGHGIFFAFYDSGTTHLRGIFDGSDPFADRISGGSIDGGFITPDGFAYFIDGLDNTLVIGVDLSTATAPEPDTLLLLGTGSLPLFAWLRRRLSRPAGR